MRHMKIEAGSTERPVVVVAVGGLEVAIGVKLLGIPKAATEICEKRKLRP